MPDENGNPASYLNGLRVQGTPKTVNLAGQLNGNHLEGPLEVWVAALVAVLTPEQRTKFGGIFEAAMRQRALQTGMVARVVADIPMPNIQS